MERHWKSFNKKVTDKEFAALSLNDRIELFEAMKFFRMGLAKGFLIKAYGEGIMMIKPKDGQGRCLYFAEIIEDQIIEMIVLLVYKKESQKLPEAYKALAFQRMKQYKENRL